MRSRDVVGHKIVEVRRETIFSNFQTFPRQATELVLDNGTVIHVFVYETEDQPQGVLEIVKKPK